MAGDRPALVMTHDYPPATGGGLAAAVRELAELLAPGYSVLVLSSRSRDHATDDRGLVPPAVPSVRYAHAGCLTAWRALRQADLVVSHWTFSFRRLATLALVAGPLLGKPTACVVHTSPDHCGFSRLRRVPRRVLLAVAALLLARCDAVIALGPSHRAALVAAGLPVTHVLPVPVRVHGQREVFRVHRTLRVIGFAGELSMMKGADRLAGVLRALTPDFSVHVAGAGPLGRRLCADVAGLPPAQRSRVILRGWIEPSAMPAFYQDIDILLVLSRTEAQCLVILEAMLSGVIVLASPTPASGDLIVHGRTGFIVDADDPAAIRERICLLRAQPGRARLIRDDASHFARSQVSRSNAAWSALLPDLTAM
ncbi:MAG TPA: glycosyltransferase family 4 protein [Streptosporangiaceae bacterium]|nr:glycosyltransferase family 4 protein [Streptosporangiaceae bacterium]